LNSRRAFAAAFLFGLHGGTQYALMIRSQYFPHFGQGAGQLGTCLVIMFLFLRSGEIRRGREQGGF
jgi:hypothetical protein